MIKHTLPHGYTAGNWVNCLTSQICSIFEMTYMDTKRGYTLPKLWKHCAAQKCHVLYYLDIVAAGTNQSISFVVLYYIYFFIAFCIVLFFPL